MATLTQPNSYDAAGLNRLLSDWRINITDPQLDWTSEWRTIAARSDDLIRNDPVICALQETMIAGTHGNNGLRFKSLYAEDADEDGDLSTSAGESAQRTAIDACLRRNSAGRFVDATGLLTRWEWEEQLDRLAIAKGDAFAIRKFIPGRPGASMATAWLMIQPYRVMNPTGLQNSDRLYEGIALGDESEPVGLWLCPAMRGTTLTYVAKREDFVYIPWIAEDGSRNVIHRVGLRPPGGYRGVSAFAPLMAFAKQVKGIIEAYVVAKRVQACHPIFIQVDDPVAAAKADRNGAVWGNNTTLEPGKVYYIGKDSTVNFAAWTFNGADMRNFLDTLYRNQFAALGYPICVVLGQMSSGSNQAARSDWMQYYRTCTRRQDAHIAQCTSIIDESILREAVARGELASPDGDWQRMLEGKYIRPARSMPDPLKEAQAVAAWAEVGRDLTSLYADAGIDFRESIMTRAENNQLMKDQGVAITTAQAVPLPNATPTPPAPGADPGAPAGESPDETQEIDPAGDGDEDADPDETQELPAKAGPAPTTRKPAAAKPGTKDAA